MATSTHTQAESQFVAELVSAVGEVRKYSLHGALEKLLGALEEKGENTPYCAIVTQQQHSPPTAAQAWRSCLSAWNRLGRFLESAPSDSLRKTRWITELKWPEDLRPVSPVRHGEVHRKADDIVRLYFDTARHTHRVPKEEVFLLITPGKLKEMLPTRFTGLLADECVLIHVMDEPGESAPRQPVIHISPALPVTSSHATDDPPADESTLAWRQRFVKTIKCLTATQVAEDVGHQAKNTSATASRWTKEGKIFSVRHAGQLLYPAFQFRHGQPLPVIARILHALGEDSTGWDYAFFLATPNAYLGGDKPMDRLHDSKMEDELVRIADRHAHPADVL